MSVEPQTSLPQWAINGLLWVVVLVSTLFTGTIGWFFKDHARRVKALEANEKNYATVLSVSEMELRLAPLVSRAEFLSHLNQMREDSEKRNDQLRDDRQRMHQENLNGGAAIRKDLMDVRAAVQEDIRAVHTRIDDLFKMR